MSSLHRAVLGLGLLVLPLLSGCPREVDEPEPPPAMACTEDRECTPPGAPCGLIYACVHGFCETEASRRVPCER